MVQPEGSQNCREDLLQASVPVRLTEKAADMVRAAMQAEQLVGHALRVGVMGSGCSGLRYILGFAGTFEKDDVVDEQHGVRILVDRYSAGHLDGTVIDYVDGSGGTGFRFDNPRIAHACGDGSLSFP